MSEETAAEIERRPRRMLDRYEIIAEIARGGMGTVLLARLEGAGGFERLMAIKLMHEHLAADEAFVTMLLDEARTAAAIHHPNAVGILDVAHSPVGYYLVMSYVEGFTLGQLVSHRDLAARDRIRVGLRVLVDACHGLHAAHTAKDAKGKPLSIVHRDVSPQNVLVGLDGVGRIVDFGIALAASRVTSSRTGVLKGKPSYMAPEQVKSEPVDARADVFALGIMAWEILTGQRLFTAEVELATLLQVLEAPIAPPSARQRLATKEIDDAVLRALARAVDARTPDARTFGVELERAASAAGLLAPAHDVADTIERLFAEAIATRQDAIRHHLAAAAGEAKPLQPGQLGLIPSLFDKGPVQRSEVEAPASGVRARTSAPDASIGEAHTLHSEPPSGRTVTLEPSEPAAPKAAAPAPAPARGARWVVVSAAILVAVAIGAWLAWPRDEAPGIGPVAEPPMEVEASAEAEEPEVAAAPEPAPEVPAEIAAPSPSEPAAAEEVATPPAAAEPERTERRARAARPRPAEETAPPSEEAPRGPTLETNPYLVH